MATKKQHGGSRPKVRDDDERGGSRPGTGRPKSIDDPDGIKHVNLRISAGQYEWLLARGNNVSQAIRELIQSAMDAE